MKRTLCPRCKKPPDPFICKFFTLPHRENDFVYIACIDRECGFKYYLNPFGEVRLERRKRSV